MNEEKIGIRYENRFVMVNYEAVMNGELKAHEIAVYVVLCAFASNGSRSCYPSYTTIAAKAGCSRSTVIRSIASLEERGFIEKINQIDEDGNNKSNMYIIKTGIKQADGADKTNQNKQESEVVSEEDHPSIIDVPAEALEEGVVSERNHLVDPETFLVVSERNGGSVTESHELHLINYNKKEEEGEEEEKELKQKIEYDYFCREMPERIGFVDTLVEIMLLLKHNGRQEQLRLLDTVDSCVVLDFMDEYKEKPISHVHSYTAWLKTVFLEFLRKREAFKKNFW